MKVHFILDKKLLCLRTMESVPDTGEYIEINYSHYYILNRRWSVKDKDRDVKCFITLQISN